MTDRNRKNPRATSPEPGYPMLKVARIDRRSFIAITGASTAALLMPSCLPRGSVEISPDLYSTRLPLEENVNRILETSGGDNLEYAVWLEYDNPRFQTFLEDEQDEILGDIDGIVESGHSFGHLESEQGIDVVEASIEEYLEATFEEAEGEAVEIFATRLELFD